MNVRLAAALFVALVFISAPSARAATLYSPAILDAAVAVGLLDFKDDLQNAPMEQAKAINFMALAVYQEPNVTTSSGALVRDRLLAQIRSVITGGKEPNANGSLSGWTHGSIASSFVLAKRTPTVWNVLTATEKSRIDWLMRAMAIAGHFGFDDGNNYRTGLGNEGNFNKSSNPNFREGYVSVMISASLYFGASELNTIFTTFNYDTYIAQFTTFGFTNILARWKSYAWKPILENGGNDAFGGSGSGVRNTFTYKGVGLDNPFGVFKKLADYMYGVDDTNINVAWVKTNAVINGLTANGYQYSWTVSGSSPYLGQAGMCFELHAVQGSSPNLTPRSSLTYACDGWNNSITSRLTLKALGVWTGSAADIADVEARMRVGSDDLIFKAQNGFAGYSSSTHHAALYEADLKNRGYFYNKEIWLKYLKPTAPTVPSAPASLTATATSSSQINLVWSDNSGNETSFKIERKTGSGGTYAQIATVAANVETYSNSGLAVSTQYYYRVRASNATGDSSYSNEANATTQAPPAVAPAITAHPANRTVTAGQTANFTITASGTAPLTYQWQRQPAGSTAWTNVSNGSGGTSASYTTISTTTSDSAAKFRCLVNNSAGTATSNAATLTVNPLTYTLTVNGGSGGGTYMAGDAVTISANAPSAGTLFDKWTISSGTPTLANANASSTTLTVPASNAAVTATYKSVLLVGTGTGLRGDYYDNADFTAFKLSRVDATVDFDWVNGTPDASIGVDAFSVVWRGEVQAQISETYTFYTTSDDGIRLWVNNVKLVDNWTDHGPTENSGTIALVAGQKYAIRMEYYESTGGAVAKLAWSSTSTSMQTIPKSQLYPGAANRAPSLLSNVTATPNPATTNDTVAFAVAANDTDGDALTYAWNFGDGTTASGSNASHKYGVPGTYAASVLVSDTRGGTASGNISVTVVTPSIPPVSIKINFQPAGAAPSGTLADSGAVFANRGNGQSYGWNADTASATRARGAANSPDTRYDTLIHTQKPENPNAVWEIVVPNGAYSVRVVCGDPSYFDSAYKVNVEGTLTVNATPTATAKWFEGTKTVTVSDGRLTVSNATGAVNNKLCFLEINNAVAARELASDAPEALPLTLTKLQLAMSFTKSGRDSIRLTATLPNLSAEFSPDQAAISIDVGAAISNFALDAKARGRSSAGSVLLKFKSQKGWQLSAALKKGAWKSNWSDGGLNNESISNRAAEVPVTVTINGQTYAGSKVLSYKAKQNKTGSAK